MAVPVPDATSTKNMIEVQNLTKRYDTKTAIADVTFSVGQGEVLGFLGPNGAGKTTTMRAITGYLPPTAGRITVDSFDVSENPLEVRRRIGYLPEHPPLYLEMNVSGYLRFVAKIKGVPKAELEDEIVRVMDKVNVLEVEDRIIGRLSKGYRQRVGLAQALLNDPPILILDEPTIGLDPKQIHEVRELIKEWSGRHTVLLSTHILPEVEQTCNRVVIIDKGRVVAVDTPENLVSQLKGAERIVVEVSGPEEDVLTRIGAIPGVLKADRLDTHNGRMRIEVESDVSEDLRPSLAQMIVQSGWGLFEMQSSRMSLEDIFLKLTTDDEESSEAAAEAGFEDEPALEGSSDVDGGAVEP